MTSCATARWASPRPGGRLACPGAGGGADAHGWSPRRPRWSSRTLLRNGEQLLLALIIPVLLLVGFSQEPLVGDRAPAGGSTSWSPGSSRSAVMSTAFTSLAIATGFERRYGVLKRLGATPLPRSGLIAAKTADGARGRAAADRA